MLGASSCSTELTQLSIPTCTIFDSVEESVCIDQESGHEFTRDAWGHREVSPEEERLILERNRILESCYLRCKVNRNECNNCSLIKD